MPEHLFTELGISGHSLLAMQGSIWSNPVWVDSVHVDHMHDVFDHPPGHSSIGGYGLLDPRFQRVQIGPQKVLDSLHSAFCPSIAGAFTNSAPLRHHLEYLITWPAITSSVRAPDCLGHGCTETRFLVALVDYVAMTCLTEKGRQPIGNRVIRALGIADSCEDSSAGVKAAHQHGDQCFVGLPNKTIVAYKNR